MAEEISPDGSSAVSQSLYMSGLSLHLPLSSQVDLPPTPRTNAPSKKSKRRRIRPSTAPSTAIKGKTELLPSIRSDSRDPSVKSLPASTISDSDRPVISSQIIVDDQSSKSEALSQTEYMQEAQANIYIHPAKPRPRGDLGVIPPPFGSSNDEPVSASTQDDERSESTELDYDWATFISAYASGRWDPHRTPTPPRSYSLTSSHVLYAAPEPSASGLPEHPADPPAHDIDTDTDNAENLTAATVSHHSLRKFSFKSDSEDEGPSQFEVHRSPAASIIKSRRNIHLKLPLSPDRVRLELRSPNLNSGPSLLDPGQSHERTRSSSNPDLTTAAATMRWAAARINLAPLSLPSPEHELTDPMRGVHATIPGSHPNYIMQSQDPMTPGGTRKARLASFWQGTQAVEGGHRLATIEGSPSTTPSGVNASGEKVDAESKTILATPAPPPAPPPASAPLQRSSDDGQNGDYFSPLGAVLEEQGQVMREAQPFLRSGSSFDNMGTVSVPALPRRVCLTRQTSSPLPTTPNRDSRLPGGRMASESINSVKAGRAAKEEQMFLELGYLAPPNPPDELERRRALYKFNIWNTDPDLNFDRIAHLAKLVFNTKGVFISLLDGHEQWFKSIWGMKANNCARIDSFCGHTILQRGDEPTVILDSHQDWRFAKNPLVTGPPHIRFYAGAPLRTQDGYNIGSLSVICDIAREDFTPRQRHTLKEFAAIAMREMELWRDKIQLRIRDRIQNSMEQFSRECLEIDTEAQGRHLEDRPDLIVGSSMDKVYDRAAKLVQRTLDVEGMIVMDVAHSEVLETRNAEGFVSVVLHHGDPETPTAARSLSAEQNLCLNEFFAKYPDGKISEGIVPPSLRPFLPTHIQYALTVPIFNIDKRPFALLCAYNASDPTKRFVLEGHELSYLRAIGVIILSAVLKRRMILADKAKSLFISNISHELRTPLHGILAAAELLYDTPLNHSQSSFLHTVQACGTSLVETVNHVLDFTKLSGNSKSGGVENVIVPTKVELMHLVEEAVDGCWIGHRARTAEMRDSGIGSVYSPPNEDGISKPSSSQRNSVETIVDIAYRKEGWLLKCEKGGIRRILMNLFGNSLKFTTEGYIHVTLRQLPHSADTPRDKIKVELSVIDTGKGISQNFLKNQLFHPFSQENPLQTGTGLGLAIVNSIVQSESVGGKVDVSSEEGVGTEIKVTFNAEVPDDNEGSSSEMEPLRMDDLDNQPTVSLVGFHSERKGEQLLHSVLQRYLASWWGLEPKSDDGNLGDIVILNNNPSLVVDATKGRETSRPFIILSSSRGHPRIMTIASDYERIGGFCRIIYKPGGPSRLRAVLKLCLHALNIGNRPTNPYPSVGLKEQDSAGVPTYVANSMPRRNSEENNYWPRSYPARPAMTPRSSTAHPLTPSWNILPSTMEEIASSQESDDVGGTVISTIAIGSGGTLLKSSVGTIGGAERRFRVLVVEDNSILRNLLIKWLTTRGYDFRGAVDGRDGVNIFEQDGQFDVVLLDLSMPVLDGIAATSEIRKIESTRLRKSVESDGTSHPTRILALTGMSSLEDKRRAFEAGVDGYLVKPVAFKTLDEMFHKLGIS